MDVSISAVLNKRNRRNLEFFAGDAFTLTLTVYATDTENLDPSSMVGSTLTLKAYADSPQCRNDYGVIDDSETPEFTIEGTEGTSNTFTFTAGNTADLIGRYRYRITKTTSNLTSVLVYGILTIS
jgi:hypothetical protein